MCLHIWGILIRIRKNYILLLLLFSDNECRRAVILQLLDEWNPNGYYTITVVVNLQFDPVLLTYLHHLSVSSSIASDNTLIDNTEGIHEKDVPSKPWVSTCSLCGCLAKLFYQLYNKTALKYF